MHISKFACKKLVGPYSSVWNVKRWFFFFSFSVEIRRNSVRSFFFFFFFFRCQPVVAVCWCAHVCFLFRLRGCGNANRTASLNSSIAIGMKSCQLITVSQFVIVTESPEASKPREKKGLFRSSVSRRVWRATNQKTNKIYSTIYINTHPCEEWAINRVVWHQSFFYLFSTVRFFHLLLILLRRSTWYLDKEINGKG